MTAQTWTGPTVFTGPNRAQGQQHIDRLLAESENATTLRRLRARRTAILDRFPGLATPATARECEMSEWGCVEAAAELADIEQRIAAAQS